MNVKVLNPSEDSWGPVLHPEQNEYSNVTGDMMYSLAATVVWVVKFGSRFLFRYLSLSFCGPVYFDITAINFAFF